MASQPEVDQDALADTSSWDTEWGDRCQQIVWIGIGMDQAKITSMLNACLLSDDEMKLGPEGWLNAFEDSLPEWDVSNLDHELVEL